MDWLRHLRVTRLPGTEIYPHPGLWLTRSDWSDNRLIVALQNFDIRVVGPLMCWAGSHRWITLGHVGEQRTCCWYCQKDKP